MCRSKQRPFKAAFETFLKFETLSATAKDLNQRKIKITRTVQGGGSWARLDFWTVENLQCVLRNTSYKGVRTYREQGEVKQVTAAWDAIVNANVFDRVQEILSSNAKGKRKPFEGKRWPYLLTGLTYCKTCGDVMCGKSAHGRNRKYPYYEHGWASVRGSTHIKELFKCNPHRVPANRIEEAVTNNVKELLTKPDFAQTLLDKAHQAHRKRMEASEVKEYQRKICGYKGQLEALVERISDLPQDISPLPFYRKMRKIEELKQQSEEALREAKTKEGMSEEAPAGLKDYRSYLTLIGKVWGGDGASAEAAAAEAGIDVATKAEWKSKLIKRLIHRINITQDSVEVYYYVGEEKINRDNASLTDRQNFFQRAGSRNLTNGAQDWT